MCFHLNGAILKRKHTRLSHFFYQCQIAYLFCHWLLIVFFIGRSWSLNCFLNVTDCGHKELLRFFFFIPNLENIFVAETNTSLLNLCIIRNRFLCFACMTKTQGILNFWVHSQNFFFLRKVLTVLCEKGWEIRIPILIIHFVFWIE